MTNPTIEQAISELDAGIDTYAEALVNHDNPDRLAHLWNDTRRLARNLAKVAQERMQMRAADAAYMEKRMGGWTSQAIDALPLEGVDDSK